MNIKQMANCVVCDSVSQVQYRCKYCSGEFCIQHRLPEDHKCFSRVVFEHVDPAWFRLESTVDDLDDETINRVASQLPATNFESVSKQDHLNDRGAAKKSIHLVSWRQVKENNKEYHKYEPEYTVGTTRDPDYSKSPDVALDGSVKTDDSGKESGTDDDEKTGGRSIFSRLMSLFQ